MSQKLILHTNPQTVRLYTLDQSECHLVQAEAWHRLGTHSRIFVGKTKMYAILEQTQVGNHFEKISSSRHVDAGEIFDCEGQRMMFVKDDEPIDLGKNKLKLGKPRRFAAVFSLFRRRNILLSTLLPSLIWITYRGILLKQTTGYQDWVGKQLQTFNQWNFKEEDDRFPKLVKTEKKKTVAVKAPAKALTPEEKRIELLRRFDPIKAEKESRTRASVQKGEEK